MRTERNIPKTDQIGLSERQLRSLPYFCGGASIKQICKDVRIAKTTYYEWIKDPLFSKELEAYRKQSNAKAIELLQSLQMNAVQKIKELMDAPTTPGAAIARGCATDILNFSFRAKELDVKEAMNLFSDRLQTIENRNK